MKNNTERPSIMDFLCGIALGVALGYLLGQNYGVSRLPSDVRSILEQSNPQCKVIDVEGCETKGGWLVLATVSERRTGSVERVAFYVTPDQLKEVKQRLQGATNVPSNKEGSE